MAPKIGAFGLHPNQTPWGQDIHPCEEEHVETCIQWLQRHTRKCGRWTQSDSYTYKHMVERWAREIEHYCLYVTNGAFIEAAHRLHYAWKRAYPGSPNAIFKMKVFETLNPNDHPVVYLLQCGPFYKIGASTQVDNRVKQLATLPPFDIELLHTIQTDDMYKLESELHERYADKRKNGEWFELEPDDVEYIKSL